jgi:hypothetical protein
MTDRFVIRNSSLIRHSGFELRILRCEGIMTRETKIGLLVGLAFIIVIGILLSDHMTSSTDPPPAVLTNAGNGVRDTVRNPGGALPPLPPVVIASQVAPHQQVRTQGDLDAQKRAQEIVRIGPGAPAAISTPAPSPGDASIVRILNPQQQQQPESFNSVPPPQRVGIQAVAQGNSTGHPIEQIAAEYNEPIVSAYPGNDRPSQSPPRQDRVPSALLEYTAQPGDTLSRMAGKLLGANTRANREAIVRANPSLQTNPDMIVVGKAYRIPSASAAAAPAAPAPAVPQPGPSGEFWYTVKEGDTLTRIAREQLGAGDSAVPALVELNRDIIKNPDSLQINSRIRLPGRPVAQIN